jgi:hypothetical protein
VLPRVVILSGVAADFLIGALCAPEATKSKNLSASFSGYIEASGEILRRPAEHAEWVAK